MLIVARYLDGRVIKGNTTDFHPERKTFRVRSADGETQEHPAKGMKALFFVQSLEGDPARSDSREFPNLNGLVRSRLWLRFLDGEQMPAWPVSPTLGERGFWVLPADNGSNIEKAYVFRDSLAEILEGAEAKKAAREERLRSKAAETRSPTRIVAL